MGSEFGLVIRGQLGVLPWRRPQVCLPSGVAGIEELAVQRLEILPPHHITVAEPEHCRAVADPDSGGLAALLHR